MKKSKKITIILVILIILSIGVLAGILGFKIFKDNQNKQEQLAEQKQTVEEVKAPEPTKPIKKIKILDLNSKTRPYAVVINNTPVAVKVQTGLNKAYMVYEFPTEGNTSRLMALYKDAENVTIGTIRSSRHNFIDYALESNAIYVHYGWSHYAEDDEKGGAINYINGLFDNGFWRNNPEKLASEHTAYTSTEKIKETATKKGYKTTAEDTVVLKYNVDEIDLTEETHVQPASQISIPYGSKNNTTSFKYDEESKMYTRYENGKACVDHETKENVTTKNIIVQKINYQMCSDNYYWKLSTVGSGSGYFITNGQAVPIKWSKSSRSAKTKYTYEDGKEIEVNDGRTYIEIQTNQQKLSIE